MSSLERKNSNIERVEKCIFCKIAKKEAKAERILETENAVSFLDMNPRAPGHSLVIPKKHVTRLTDLEDKLVADVFKMTREVVKILEKALNPDAFTIGINDGEVAGQVIPHLHVNVIPRFKGDGGGPIHAVVYNPPSEKFSEIAEKIRRTLK
jgi:histidine triad (HIT) family protein